MIDDPRDTMEELPKVTSTMDNKNKVLLKEVKYWRCDVVVVIQAYTFSLGSLC